MTPTQIAAMKQAIEALERADSRDGMYSYRCEIDALRAALEEPAPVQGPVAWWKQYPDGSISVVESRTFLADDAVATGWRALGFTDTSPQAQQPAPPADVPMLTEDEVEAVQEGIAVDDFAHDLVRRTARLVRQKAGLQ